jgi:putative nucleotidyltransferase with HDIG domain
MIIIKLPAVSGTSKDPVHLTRNKYVMGDILKSYVRKIKELPTLPSTAQEILRLSNDPMMSVDTLMNIVETDPAISAKILSVANSAFFSYPVRTTKLNDAIMRIGFSNVKSIAVGISVLSFLGDGRKTEGYLRLYNHSVAVGLTARYIADSLRLRISADILIDGILHDLGYLVLYRYFPDIYQEILKSSKDAPSLLAAEKSIISYSHADIGYWLADQWYLPDTIKDTVLYHHMPCLARKSEKQVAIIHIADYIASKNDFSPIEMDPNNPLDYASFEILSISDNDLKELETSINNIPFSDEIFSMPRC